MNLTSRAAVGLADLQAAADVLSQAWLARAPYVNSTPGDLSWWYAQAWPADLSERLRLWSSRDRVVGWSWSDAVELEFQVWSGEPAVDAEVKAALLGRAIGWAADRAATGADGALEVWAADGDRGLLDRLRASGFRLAPTPARGHAALSQFQQTVADIADGPRRRLPAGYRIRPVAGLAEIGARVEVHRSAFAPSRMSVGKYERLTELPNYRFEDDLIVEGPDGSFAAFAMAWWDPVAEVGQFEPVGTHPEHRRLGLAGALLDHALRRYAALGARLVQVYSDPANVAAEALYPSVGFRRLSLHRPYRRPAA
jgi:mycothiol synthase